MLPFAVLEVMTTSDNALIAWRNARDEGDNDATLSSPEVRDALMHLTLHQTVYHLPRLLGMREAHEA